MRALIIGIDGQDGFYLEEFLRSKGYEVYGVVRKKTGLREEPNRLESVRYRQIFADLMDFSSIVNAIREANPDEIYNFAGQSEIPLSWHQPIITAQVNGVGVILLLEAVRLLNPKIKLFQASSSEMFGQNPNQPLTENSTFMPRNPYGTAKLFAHWSISNYREKYGVFCCSGILFNHESPRRGSEFVTRKITRAAAAISLGYQNVLELGDLNAVRDWGYAGDYVRAMWLMLQQDVPKDYIIATGKGHTVREFSTCAFAAAGIDLEWTGDGYGEVGFNKKTGETVVRVNPKLCRNQKNDVIRADPSNIQRELGFIPEHSFDEMIKEMIHYDKELVLGKKK